MEKDIARTRLVLVEDDRDTLEAFSILLGEKYSVFAYASAVAALQALEAAKPDVLVLDIGMQPVDGIECLKKIRATPRYRTVPAVAVTGFARDVERRSFLESGFQAVVAKPIIDLPGLMAVIDRLVHEPAARVRPRSAPPPASARLHLDPRLVIEAFRPGESDETDGRGPA